MKYIVEIENGTKIWRNEKGLFHRDDGPAIEFSDGTKEWYKDGMRHREDGHAVERAGGIKEWWLNGVEYTPIQFRIKMNEKNTINLQNDMYEALKAMHKAFVEQNWSSNNFMGTEYSDEEQNAINKCVRAIGSFDLLKNG